MEYNELLAANQKLREAMPPADVQIAVLSNITIDPIKEILEYPLRAQGISADVRIGRFDNIVQDSRACGDCKVVVIFWEIVAIFENLWNKGTPLDDSAEEAITAHLIEEIDLVLNHLAPVPLVLINAFTALPHSACDPRTGRMERACGNLNARLKAAGKANVLVVDTGKVLAQLSLAAALDWRLYYLTRCLYSKAFLAAYVEQIRPALLSLFGKARKALIFDCDNTLWKGIVGEDGLDGIELSAATPAGRVFREVQAIALDLSRQGVLLGLCSKNNPEDVDAVLERHPDMLLRSESLVVKRVNWCDKATNLRAIAAELNIGLDAIAFVDDSPYEISGLQQQLPEIECLQVPTTLFQYPSALRAFTRCFGAGPVTAEDSRRADMYRTEVLRRSAGNDYGSVEDFIRSLGLHLRLHFNARQFVPRVAQLTQKTNQFNLTTIRYSEEEITRVVADQRALVISAEVADRFGDYGLTGVVIVFLDPPARTATIDTFLLSCRVLGRHVETAILDAVIAHLSKAGFSRVLGRYVKTRRNSQVEDYYDRHGFVLTNELPEQKDYLLDVSDYRPANIDYIGVEYA
jgi:FkbH-like protein